MAVVCRSGGSAVFSIRKNGGRKQGENVEGSNISGHPEIQVSGEGQPEKIGDLKPGGGAVFPGIAPEYHPATAYAIGSNSMIYRTELELGPHKQPRQS